MKILVNRKIKQLFLYVLLAVVAFTAASVLIICLGLKNAALYVAIAAVLMTLIIFAALYWYFRDQSKTICPIFLSGFTAAVFQKIPRELVWDCHWPKRL